MIMGSGSTILQLVDSRAWIPKADEFENLSPYNYASNNPITCIDLWGLQGKPVNEIRDKNGNITAATTTAQQTTYIPPIVEFDVPLSQNSGDNFIDKVSDNLGNSSSLVEATGMILENTTVTKTGATAGAVVAIVKTSADAATTDFSNSEETADFFENTTQTAVETEPGHCEQL